MLGAPPGGLLTDATSYRAALGAGIAGLTLSAVTLAASPFRHADHADAAARTDTAGAEPVQR